MTAKNRGAELARELLVHHSVLGAHEDGVTALLQRGRPIHAADGHILCEEGKAGSTLYFLLEGQVRVSKERADEQPEVLATLDAPAILGHVSLIDGSPRSASCTVIGSATVVALEQAVYDRLVAERSVAGTTLRRMLLSSLIQQLSAGNAKIRSVLAGEAERPRKRSVPKPRKPSSPPGASKPAADVSAARAPATRSPRQPAARSDVSAQELLRIAGVMEDWQVDMRG